MRLLHSSTSTLKDFGSKPPPYAILSHTWGDDEVIFQDMTDLEAASKKDGFRKIEGCCRQARKDGFDWVWIDTCCIDKSSSAELSETINSMYRWYESSMKCYALLSDLLYDDWEAHADADTDSQGLSTYNSRRFFESRWWKRGWILQELIAPYDVEFFSVEWNHLTAKRYCVHDISNKTGIARGVLTHINPPSAYCAAERMVWAADRETTRKKDMLYCLLGIFDVHMPLLYGEGAKAFIRLRQEILASSEDYTILMWHLRQLDVAAKVLEAASYSTAPVLWMTGALAPAPSEFTALDEMAFRRWGLVGERAWSASDVHPNNQSLSLAGEPPTLTSRGLRVSMFLKEITMKDLGQDLDAKGRLLQRSPEPPETLVNFLSQFPHGTFVGDTSRSVGSEPVTVFLGALQTQRSRLESTDLPCLVLVAKHSLLSASQGRRAKQTTLDSFSVVRFLWIPVAVSELDDPSWILRTCYLAMSSRKHTIVYMAKFSSPDSGDGMQFLCAWRTAHPQLRSVVEKKDIALDKKICKHKGNERVIKFPRRLDYSRSGERRILL